MKNIKLIHLLYTPTMRCNLSCDYCYLGKQTRESSLKKESQQAIETLKKVLLKLEEENIVAFNVSLHGGEVTMLPPKILEGLFEIINKYYIKNWDILNANGYKKTSPHIKTNLFNFDKIYDLLEKHKVSISASIDLPLDLHSKHRIKQNGERWLEKTKKNLALLSKYPYGKKISSTFSEEHILKKEHILKDIWYIHNELKFDMTNFNVMYAFPSKLNKEDKGNNILKEASDVQQLDLYQFLKKNTVGTELEYGFMKNWFDEFTPSYCTNSVNCGEKFYLLQSNGDIYSCVRSQGLKEFYYGNALEQKFSEIMENGKNKIKNINENYGLNKDCKSCDHLSKCNTGCPVVKINTNKNKSYTCELQKEIYIDFPKSYKINEKKNQYLKWFVKTNHPNEYKLYKNNFLKEDKENLKDQFFLPKDINENKNKLMSIIEEDSILKDLFSDEMFILEHDSEILNLQSQILKVDRELLCITEEDNLMLHINPKIIDKNCDELLKNTIYIQLLKDNKVLYGDEKREKQEHVWIEQIYLNYLKESNLFKGYLMFDLGMLLRVNKMYKNIFTKNVLNNLFITTSCLRDYHYQKQKNNAFYHIQTINLPFQNFEFFYINKEE